MSKSGKSVSDIMQHRVVFPNGREQSFSAQFEVRNHPVVLKAYNMGCDTVGHIEMGHMDGCGGTTWTPFSPLCDQVLILACTNIVSIMVPGLYRVVFRNRITGELETGLDDLLVTVTETDMPASMLANFGGSTMACGNRVSIHSQPDGCIIINVDDVPTTICPGSNVTCSPSGDGILINGELCAFPTSDAVSVSVAGNCLTITVGTEVTSFCLPDAGTDSVTIASMDLTTGLVTITNPDGSEIVFNGRDTDSVTTASMDLATGAVTITNPDASTVTFNGNDSVTTASMDADAMTVTIVNPDGSSITFPYGGETPEFLVVTDESLTGDGTDANPLSVNWADLCDNVSAVTDVEDRGVLLCGADDGPVVIDPSDLLKEMCFDDVPDLGDTCGTVDTLVVVTDATGCGRLNKTREATKPQYNGFFGQVATWLPPNTLGYTLPADFNITDPLTEVYSFTDLVADGGTDPTDRSGVDHAKVGNSVMSRVTIDNPCARVFNVLVQYSQPAYTTAQEAYQRLTNFTFRWRYNGGPWVYVFNPGSGQITAAGGFRGTTSVRDYNTTVALQPGNIEFEVFMLRIGNPTQEGDMNANTYLPGFANGNPRVTLRPSY